MTQLYPFVSVPPEHPTILDQWGRQLNGTVGPHEEGDDITLTCRTVGGHPQPAVRWLVNGILVDDQYEHNAVKPLTAKILKTVSPLVADKRYEATCESTGSRPPAIITWYKGKRQLRRTKVNDQTYGDFSFCFACHFSRC
nr:unnamed protein product [Callosobruchus analis]